MRGRLRWLAPTALIVLTAAVAQAKAGISVEAFLQARLGFRAEAARAARS